MRAVTAFVIVSAFTTMPVLADPQVDKPATAGASLQTPTGTHPSNASQAHAVLRGLIEIESEKAGLPPDVAEAVMFVESGYNPATVGDVGEIGLMQVRPQTAAMMGFRGSLTELATPEVNIHYGVTYLAKAWRLAGGELCRALMKYRAGHGEERMSPRSVSYCARARDRLAALHSSFAAAGSGSSAPVPATQQQSSQPDDKSAADRPIQPRDVYAHYKQGTAAASRAYWAAHEARIGAMKQRLEARWRAASG